MAYMRVMLVVVMVLGAVSSIQAFMPAPEDPADNVVWSALLGGSFGTVARKVSIGSDGCLYVVLTGAWGLPVTPGAFSTSYNDCYVAKLSPDASQIIYATYLGGSGYDLVTAMALGEDGSVYLAGRTDSTDFPTTPDAYDTTYNGGDDVFVCKLSPDGTQLLYSTYLGGAYTDYAYAIAVDAQGCAYVTGAASSGFPYTQGAFSPSWPNGFTAKLASDGSSLDYCAALGGCGIAIDSSGCAVLATTCYGDELATPGAYDTTANGMLDVAVVKLSSDGSGIIFGTLFGGPDADLCTHLATDADGYIYVCGEIDYEGFPTTPGAYDETHNGSDDCFVAKFSPDCSALIYCTLIGGAGDDTPYGFAVDAAGQAYVVGETGSADFPVTPAALDSLLGGYWDGFVVELNATGSGLVHSTLMGGEVPIRSADSDGAMDVALTADGCACVVGYTMCSDFPVTPGALHYVDSFACGFITKLRTPLSFRTSAYYGGTVAPTAGDYVCELGEAVPISATPSSGCSFHHWQGDVSDPTQSSTTVTMDSAKTVTAVFTASSLGAARGSADGTGVRLEGQAVTAVDSGFFYIEELNRSAGVKALWTGSAPELGSAVTVEGRITRSGVERVIEADDVQQVGQAEVKPLFLTNRALGGCLGGDTPAGFTDPTGASGLYNLGLLVRTSGRVTYTDNAHGWGYIDDGSGLTDGNTLASGQPVKGVSVVMPTGVELPAVGADVVLTGVSSSQAPWYTGNSPARTLRMRSQSDVYLPDGGVVRGRITAVQQLVFDRLVETWHPYSPFPYNDEEWYVYGPDSTTRIRVHFTRLELEWGDYLYIEDGRGNVVQTFSSGPQLLDFWSEWVDRPLLKLHLQCDDTQSAWGFEVDKYEAVVENAGVPGVTVKLDYHNFKAQTDADGWYEFSGLNAGNYTVTPDPKAGVFTPSEHIISLGQGGYVPRADFRRQ